jgi:hypothetical protein
LKSIKNRTKTNDKSDNHELLETVRGKLTQSAGIWFDNNEASFKKWSDFDEIVDLGREIDPQMSHPTIIRYLISGLTPDFQKELSRRESAMNTLDEFLKYVKIEQDLQVNSKNFVHHQLIPNNHILIIIVLQIKH